MPHIGQRKISLIRRHPGGEAGTRRFRGPAALLAGCLLVIAVLTVCILSPQTDLLRRPLHVAARPQKADVIAVFSSGTLNACRAHPNLFYRERHGAKLWREGYSRSGKLILSGIYTRPAVSGVSVAECRDRLAAMLGVPPSALVLDNESKDTLGNARHTRHLMGLAGWRDALLVTSDYHLFRAKRTFEAQGIQVYPAAAWEPPPTGGWWDNDRRHRLYRLLYEYGALLKYAWYGYL